MPRKSSKQKKIDKLWDELESIQRDDPSRSSKKALELLREKLKALDPKAKFGRVNFMMAPARRQGQPFGFHWGLEADGPKGSVEAESACETLEEAIAEAALECEKIGRKLPDKPEWSRTKPALSKRKYGTVLKGQAPKTPEPVHGRSSSVSVV